jgi:hypothetical protein
VDAGQVGDGEAIDEDLKIGGEIIQEALRRGICATVDHCCPVCDLKPSILIDSRIPGNRHDKYG